MCIGATRGWRGALALVPGAGQLYNHQPRKALYFGVALAAWMVLLVLTFYRPVSHWIGYGYALMATWAFHDGFMTARRINRCEDYWVRRMGFFSAWILYVCIAYLIWHALLASDFIVTIRRVNDASMAPTLCAGERVLINNVGCWFFRPRVGELVVYHPPPMQLRILESTLVIREYGAMTADSTVEQPQAIGRIVAGPGQVFERVGGQFLVDGHPIELDPWLARLNLPSKFRLEAPKGSYIIPCDYGGKGWASSSIVDKAPLKFWDALGKPIDMKKEWVLRNWAEVCTVKRGWIKGVVSLVYDPPPVRRLLRPVSFASEGLPGADAEEAGH